MSSWPQAASLSWNEPLVTRSPKRWPGSKRLPWGSTRPSIMSSGGSYGAVILPDPLLDREPFRPTVDRFSARSPRRAVTDRKLADETSEHRLHTFFYLRIQR